MKTKINNVSLVKSGKGNITPRISIPHSWLKKIGITEKEREVLLTFDEKGKKIIIEKKERE